MSLHGFDLILGMVQFRDEARRWKRIATRSLFFLAFLPAAAIVGIAFFC